MNIFSWIKALLPPPIETIADHKDLDSAKPPETPVEKPKTIILPEGEFWKDIHRVEYSEHTVPTNFPTLIHTKRAMERLREAIIGDEFCDASVFMTTQPTQAVHKFFAAAVNEHFRKEFNDEFSFLQQWYNDPNTLHTPSQYYTHRRAFLAISNEIARIKQGASALEQLHARKSKPR